MKSITVVIMSLLLFGCTTIEPIDHEIDPERSFAAPEPVVWAAIMDYFTRNTIQIKTLERASGVVYAEREYINLQQVELLNWAADCGRYAMMMPGWGSLSLNLFLYKKGTGVTVRVNTNFNQKWWYQSAFALIDIEEIRPCTSRGVLEESILQSISEYVDERSQIDNSLAD